MLGIKKIGNLRILFRTGSPDEEILQEYYQNSRFFVPEYEPKEDHIILDVGAHIGIYAIQIAARVSKGKAYAIEPNYDNYRYLKTNVELNNLSNVSVHLLALSDFKGRTKLYSGRSNWGHSICREMVRGGTGEGEEVDTDTLCNFLKDNDIDVVNYMKMNVEGAEYCIILSTPQTALRRIHHMLVEFHPVSSYNEKDLVSFLNECGFATKIRYSQIGRAHV